jgi:hypothetical protein
MADSFEIYGTIARSMFEWTYKTRFHSKEEARTKGRMLEKSGRLPLGTILWDVRPSGVPVNSEMNPDQIQSGTK